MPSTSSAWCTETSRHDMHEVDDVLDHRLACSHPEGMCSWQTHVTAPAKNLGMPEAMAICKLCKAYD